MTIQGSVVTGHSQQMRDVRPRELRWATIPHRPGRAWPTSDQTFASTSRC